MATQENFIIDAGTTFETVIDVEAQAGVTWNIANYEARGQIKKSHGALSVAANFTCELDVNAETLTISLAPEDTIDLSGQHVYDIQLHTEDETVAYRILEGSVTFKPAVTKPPVANTP